MTATRTPTATARARTATASLLLTMLLPVACDEGDEPSAIEPAGGKADAADDQDVPSACALAYAPAEPLRILTEGAFPPFNDVDDAGNPVGWEVDYLELLMERVGVAYTLELAPWDGCCDVDESGTAIPPAVGDGLFSEVFSGKADLALASISNNDRRTEVFAFSERYGFTPLHQELVYRTEDADAFDFAEQGVAAMNGRTIAVQQGTNQAFYMQRLDARPDISLVVVSFPAFDDAVTALLEGAVDALYGFGGNPRIEEGVAAGELLGDSSLRELDSEGHDLVWGTGAAFLARPDIEAVHPGLLGAIDCAIEELAAQQGASGSTVYDTLGERWNDGLLYCNPLLSDEECRTALGGEASEPLGCYYNGDPYPDGTRVGGLVCEDGQWNPG